MWATGWIKVTYIFARSAVVSQYDLSTYLPPYLPIYLPIVLTVRRVGDGQRKLSGDYMVIYMDGRLNNEVGQKDMTAWRLPLFSVAMRVACACWQRYDFMVSFSILIGGVVEGRVRCIAVGLEFWGLPEPCCHNKGKATERRKKKHANLGKAQYFTTNYLLQKRQKGNSPFQSGRTRFNSILIQLSIPKTKNRQASTRQPHSTQLMKENNIYFLQRYGIPELHGQTNVREYKTTFFQSKSKSNTPYHLLSNWNSIL